MTQDRSTGRHIGADHAGQVPPPVSQPYPDEPVPSAPPMPPASRSVDVPDHTATRSTPGVRRSRFGGLWVGLIVAAVILVLLLVFILQNSQSTQIEFLWMSGHAPLAVAILLGVTAGALLVAVPGTVRILQLRKTVRHPKN
jgi:uncharacterized integral membrane protein